MFIKHSNLLCKNTLRLINITVRKESDGGSIRDAGGRFAKMEEAREAKYFQKKNQEYLQHIKEELKKGKTMEQVIDDTKTKLKERAKCEKEKGKGTIADHEDCTED